MKSERARYIRVAAIDIVISEGIRNIYMAERYKEIVSSATGSIQRRTKSNAADRFRRIKFGCQVGERESYH